MSYAQIISNDLLVSNPYKCTPNIENNKILNKLTIESKRLQKQLEKMKEIEKKNKKREEKKTNDTIQLGQKYGKMQNLRNISNLSLQVQQQQKDIDASTKILKKNTKLLKKYKILK